MSSLFLVRMHWLFSLDRVSADPYIFLLPLMVLITLGITQLLYVIPLVLWLNRKRRFTTMKGVIIGAVFTALLNGACYLFVEIGTGNFL